jgi:hypothetical protein
MAAGAASNLFDYGARGLLNDEKLSWSGTFQSAAMGAAIGAGTLGVFKLAALGARLLSKAWQLAYQGGKVIASAAGPFIRQTSIGFTNLGAFPRFANFSRSAEVLKEAIEIAKSSAFIRLAKKLGFNPSQIGELPERLLRYVSRAGEILSGGFVTEEVFLIGRRGLFNTRWQRVAHELGHVLDDIANPGLFERATQPGFGFRNYFRAESVAYRFQYGFNPIPLTALNAGFQSHPIITAGIFGGWFYGSYRFSQRFIFGQR